MKMFHAVGNGKKGRSKTSWEIVKAPRQPDSNQCGFYVMAYMRTLIEHMPDIDDKESVQARTKKEKQENLRMAIEGFPGRALGVLIGLLKTFWPVAIEGLPAQVFH
nr:uncharacterized protein LOC109184124 [Ipomoea trifida]